MWNIDPTTWDPNRVLYRYLDAEGTYLSLLNLNVKCSSPALFNDPFDTTTDVRFPFDMQEFSESLRDNFKILIFGDDDPLFEELTDMARLVIKLRQKRNEFDLDGSIDFSSPLLLDAERRLFDVLERDRIAQEKFLLTWRINCLTDQFDNLLMWAHYADMHKGAVIGYQCVPEIDSCYCVAGPITYSAEIPSLGTAEEWTRHILGIERINFSDRMMKMTMTKSSEWKYEREFRYMLPMQDKDRPFDLQTIEPQEIHSVYLGCRMESDYKDRIVKIVQDNLPHVDIYQSKKSATLFELEFERI